MKRLLVLTAAALLLTAADDPKTATEHVVKAGETLGGIANRAEVPRILIIEANGLVAPYTVKVGQKLVIPRRRSHTVAEGETGLGIALDYGVPWKAIATANGLDPKAPVKPGQKLTIPTLAKGAIPHAATTPPEPKAKPAAAAALAVPQAWLWPLDGPIKRKFKPREGGDFHDGIDIVAPAGTAARASAAGEVIYAAQGPAEYGLTVIVHHGGRWTTTYSFLDKITVKEGDKVGAGERVGLVGQTGLAKEPQLHFEVRRNRVAMDPLKYLAKKKS